MEVTEQQRRLEAAGWETGWSYSLEKQLISEEELRYFVIWATKGGYSVRVTGRPDDTERIWQHVYSEAKAMDPSGLSVPPPA